MAIKLIFICFLHSLLYIGSYRGNSGTLDATLAGLNFSLFIYLVLPFLGIAGIFMIWSHFSIKKKEKESDIKRERKRERERESTPEYRNQIKREENERIKDWEMKLFYEWNKTFTNPEHKDILFSRTLFLDGNLLFADDEYWDKVRKPILLRNRSEYEKLTNKPIEDYIINTSGLKKDISQLHEYGKWRETRTFMDVMNDLYPKEEKEDSLAYLYLFFTLIFFAYFGYKSIKYIVDVFSGKTELYLLIYLGALVISIATIFLYIMGMKKLVEKIGEYLK